MPGSNDYSTYYGVFGEQPVNTSNVPAPAPAPTLIKRPAVPAFDPNAGRQDAYNQQWEARRKELADQVMSGDSRRINMRREQRRFQRNFDRNWDNSAPIRQTSYQIANSGLEQPKLTPKAEQALANPSFGTTHTYGATKVDPFGDRRAVLDAQGKQVEQTAVGYNGPGQERINNLKGFDNKIAAENAAIAKKRRLDDFYLAEANKYGFETLDAVKKWQKDNGLYPDGYFGKKSKAMFEHLKESAYIDEQNELLDWAAGEEQAKLEQAKLEQKQQQAQPVYSYVDKYGKLYTDIPAQKQGGSMNRIKYFQQGGAAQQGQANAFMQAILQGDPDAIAKLIEAADKGDNEAGNIIKTILQEAEKGNQQLAKAAEVIKATLQQKPSMKWGSKLQYIRSLKYAKGGKTCPSCQAVEKGAKVEMKKCGGKKAKKRYFGGYL